MSSVVWKEDQETAFVLGAGLGTRLKPLTLSLPKPLVPFQNRPLIHHAFETLRRAGVRQFIVNTHHLSSKWDEFFPEGLWENCPIQFRHEPILLETGGGLKNIEDLLPPRPFWVYNSDIYSQIDLKPLAELADADPAPVALVVKSQGEGKHLSIQPRDAVRGDLLDIRNMLGTNSSAEGFQFTGIYRVKPSFLELLTPGVKVSVISTFLELIRRGMPPLTLLADEGAWMDLGDRVSYLQAHAQYPYSKSPRIHPSANIHPTASIDEFTFIGEACEVGEHVNLRHSVLWSHAKVCPHADLNRVIVRSHETAEGMLTDVDV